MNPSDEPVPWPWFRGDNQSHPLGRLPDPPPWRANSDKARKEKGTQFQVNREPGSKTVDMVNAALLLRRPLLVTGKPGTGKSTLARAIAEELGLGEILVWSITTRTSLQGGLYHYDAIGRLHAVSIRRQRQELRDARRRAAGIEAPETKGRLAGERTRKEDGLDIGNFIRLGPLGTALAVMSKPMRDGPTSYDGILRPRVLLIDEIDKGDIDLPNDLLHVFEEGEFEIPELTRLPKTARYESISVRTHDRDERTVRVVRGRVRCEAFPLVVMTSNGEREFPPAFLRRCLRLELPLPTYDQLTEIVKARLGAAAAEEPEIRATIQHFLDLRDGSKVDPMTRDLAVDQLLNAVLMIDQKIDIAPIRDVLFRPLDSSS